MCCEGRRPLQHRLQPRQKAASPDGPPSAFRKMRGHVFGQSAVMSAGSPVLNIEYSSSVATTTGIVMP